MDIEGKDTSLPFNERRRFIWEYFTIEKCTDAAQYTAMKTAIQKAYPFFDDNALDAARFLFGATTGEVIWHEGWMSIMEVVADTELSTIWFSALKFFRNKISGSNGYVPPDQYNNDFGGEPGSLSNVMPLQQSVIRNIKQHAYSKDDKHCDKLTVRDMHRAVYSIAFAERVLHQESDDACSDDNRNSLCQHIDSACAVRWQEKHDPARGERQYIGY